MYPDLLRLITDCIHDVPTWCAWRLVCSTIYKHSQSRQHQMTNQLCNIVLATWDMPQCYWSWTALSANPNITQKMIDVIPVPWNMRRWSLNVNFKTDIIPQQYKAICWESLSENKAISLKYIADNKYLPWDFHKISSNPNITMEFVLSIPVFMWHWDELSCNSAISMDNIVDNLTLPWNFEYVSMNPNMTFKFISNNIDKIHWLEVSDNYGISIRDIIKYKTLPWNWEIVSTRKDITIAHVVQNLDVAWSWYLLSRIIPMEDIINNPVPPWNFKAMSFNKSLRIRHVLSDPQRWSFRGVSANSGITMADIVANPQLPWKIKYISSNPNLTIDFVVAHPHSDWDWIQISSNKRLTSRDVLSNLDQPWKWSAMSGNRFGKPKIDSIIFFVSKYITL